MHDYILMVRASVDTFLLVHMGPGGVLPVVYIHVVGNMAVLVQRMSLYRFLMLLLDLPMLW